MWEYCFHDVSGKPREDEFLDELNRLGREGWELVSQRRRQFVTRQVGAEDYQSYSECLFKRRLQSR